MAAIAVVMNRIERVSHNGKNSLQSILKFHQILLNIAKHKSFDLHIILERSVQQFH